MLEYPLTLDIPLSPMFRSILFFYLYPFCHGFIYQIMTDRWSVSPTATCWNHPSKFCGGRLRSVIDHLDYVQSLGATTLMISPLTPNVPWSVGGQDPYHYYWTYNLTGIDERQATVEDVLDLVSQLKERNMTLMIDMVLNHIGPLPLQADDPWENALPLWRNRSLFWDYQPCTLATLETCWYGDPPFSLSPIRYGLPTLDARGLEAAEWVSHLIGPSWIRIDSSAHLNLNFSQHLYTLLKQEGHTVMVEDIFSSPDDLLSKSDGFMACYAFDMNTPMRLQHILQQIEKYPSLQRGVVSVIDHDCPVPENAHPGWIQNALTLTFTLPLTPLVWAGLEWNDRVFRSPFPLSRLTEHPRRKPLYREFLERLYTVHRDLQGHSPHWVEQAGYEYALVYTMGTTNILLIRQPPPHRALVKVAPSSPGWMCHQLVTPTQLPLCRWVGKDGLWRLERGSTDPFILAATLPWTPALILYGISWSGGVVAASLLSLYQRTTLGESVMAVWHPVLGLYSILVRSLIWILPAGQAISPVFLFFMIVTTVLPILFVHGKIVLSIPLLLMASTVLCTHIDPLWDNPVCGHLPIVGAIVPSIMTVAYGFYDCLDSLPVIKTRMLWFITLDIAGSQVLSLLLPTLTFTLLTLTLGGLTCLAVGLWVFIIVKGPSLPALWNWRYPLQKDIKKAPWIVLWCCVIAFDQSTLVGWGPVERETMTLWNPFMVLGVVVILTSHKTLWGILLPPAALLTWITATSPGLFLTQHSLAATVAGIRFATLGYIGVSSWSRVTITLALAFSWIIVSLRIALGTSSEFNLLFSWVCSLGLAFPLIKV